MKLVRNSALKSMSIYAISLFLMKGTSLMMLPVLANYLSPSQLGQLEIIATTTACLCLIVGLSMHESLYRFVGAIKSRRQKLVQAASIYYSCIIISAVLCLTLILIIQQLKHFLNMFTEYQLILVVVVLLFESALAISTAWLRMQDKAKTFLKISVACTVLQVVLVLTVLMNNPDVTLIFATGVLATFVQFLILHIINHFPPAFPSYSDFKKYLFYSMPLMLSSVVIFGLNGAERWLIAYSSSLETLGLYSIAAKFALAMCILVQPFGMWWMPKRFETLNHSGATKTSTITEIGIAYICVLAISVGIGAQLVIRATLPEVYAGACALVIGTIFMAMLKEISDLLNLGLLYRKKTHWLLSINIISTALGLLLCWITLHIGVWGIILSIISAQATRLILITYFSQRFCSIPYKYFRTLSIIVIALSILGITQWITTVSGLMLLALCLLVITSSICWYLKQDYLYRLLGIRSPRLI